MSATWDFFQTMHHPLKTNFHIRKNNYASCVSMIMMLNYMVCCVYAEVVYLMKHPWEISCSLMLSIWFIGISNLLVHVHSWALRLGLWFRLHQFLAAASVYHYIHCYMRRLNKNYILQSSIIGQIGHCIGGNLNIHIWAWSPSPSIQVGRL